MNNGIAKSRITFKGLPSVRSFIFHLSCVRAHCFVQKQIHYGTFRIKMQYENKYKIFLLLQYFSVKIAYGSIGRNVVYARG